MPKVVNAFTQNSFPFSAFQALFASSKESLVRVLDQRYSPILLSLFRGKTNDSTVL